MKFKKILKRAILFFCIWVIMHIGYTIIDGLSDKGQSADIAVVLGTKVNEDGTLSTRLEKRLECGMKLYLNGRIKMILVSGGYGKEEFYEGDKMKEYLVDNQVPDSVIVVDNMGYNTRSTVKNAINLKDNLNFNSVIAVSQYFHLTRTKKLFRKSGFSNVQSASPRYFEMRDIFSLLREFIAFYVK